MICKKSVDSLTPQSNYYKFAHPYLYMLYKWFMKLTTLALILVNSLTLASAHHADKLLPNIPNAMEQKVCELGDNAPISRAYKANKGNYLSCSQITAFNDTLNEVKAIVKDAPKVNLFIQQEYPNASFDMGSIIRIPLTLTFSGKYGMTYRGSYFASHTILAHEYGHAIFANKMKKYDFYNKIQALSMKASNLEINIQEAYAKGNPGGITDHYFNLLSKINKQRREDKELQATARITRAYNELFADVVAVAVLNNKSAITNALFYNEMSDNRYEFVLARQFSNNYLDMNGPYMFEEHTMFAPTRQFIGENLWPITDKEKTELIEKVFQASVIEIKKGLKRDKQPRAKELNRQLIATLKKLYKLAE